ncbi:hypothetical protein D3C78_1702640 [compost metagenome]
MANSGLATIRWIASCNLSNIGAGVLAGASTPCQEPVTKLGICDAIVGTPGVAANGLALVTATALILPACTRALVATTLAMALSIWPPARSAKAWAPPL